MLTLYKQPLPEATTEQAQSSLGTQLSEQGVLGSDAIVEALSTQAADRTLAGFYPQGDWSSILAAELKELSDSSLSGLPLSGAGGIADLSGGYYEIESATVESPHAAGTSIYQWDLSLTTVGTRKSHFQAVETTPSQPSPGHPFGNDTSAIISLPAAAINVRAIDSTSNPTQRVRPEPVETVATEFGDVDLYDATALSIDAPVYIYDVAKDAQPAVDTHVYDTRGHDSKYVESGSGRVRQWQSVYTCSHEFSSASVLSNHRTRITLRELPEAGGEASFVVEKWSENDKAWIEVTLPSYPEDLDTEWSVSSIDLTHIGQARVAAQVEFEAVAGTNAGDVYSVDVELERGREALEVWVPGGASGAIPIDLETMLEPITATSQVDSGVEQGLVAREEVRR